MSAKEVFLMCSVNGENMIYADNAATTKLAPEALDAMMPYLTEEYGNPSQPYSFARKAKQALKWSRETVAECVGAMPEEIIFTSGGSEGDNWAIKGPAIAGDLRQVIVSSIEHHAILNACTSIEKLGCRTAYLPVNVAGVVNPDELRKCIVPPTRLISVMMSNNEIGGIQPIQEMAKIAHLQAALFHTDAVQAVGHIPINVKKLDIDMLSASAHKFNGPRGVGFFFLKNGTPFTPIIDGGSQEFGLRAGTENVASIVGMATALKMNCEKMGQHRELLLALEEELISTLQEKKVDFIRNGAEPRVPGNVSISVRNALGEVLLHRLDLMGICISTGSACDSKNTQLSHVVQALHMPGEYAYGTIRVSFGIYNVRGDGVKIGKAIAKIVGQIQKEY